VIFRRPTEIPKKNAEFTQVHEKSDGICAQADRFGLRFAKQPHSDASIPGKESGRSERMWTAAPWFLSLLVTGQILGITSAALARISERWGTRAIFQQIFLASLLGVFAMTLIAFASGAACWFGSATTLPVMVVCATIDLRPTVNPSPTS
jgi:hypothetical protein